MGQAEFLLDGVLKLGHLAAHNEILRGEDRFHCFQQQRPDGAIFARKIQTGHLRRGAVWTFLPVSHVADFNTGNRVDEGGEECIQAEKTCRLSVAELERFTGSEPKLCSSCKSLSIFHNAT